jgi:hypothetical protein
VVAGVANILAFSLTQHVLTQSATMPFASFSTPHVTEALVLTTLFSVVVALAGLALGHLWRAGAPAITSFALLFYVIPPLALLLPTRSSVVLQEYLPLTLGRDTLSTRPFSLPNTISGSGALADAALVVVLLLVAAAVSLTRRDIPQPHQ